MTFSPGTLVRVQNPVSKLWDRAGVITEALSHRQYTVKLKGSGRITLRNRKHLRVSVDKPATTSATPTAEGEAQASLTPTPEARHKPR